jgi:hypothetical protein
MLAQLFLNKYGIEVNVQNMKVDISIVKRLDNLRKTGVLRVHL